jgi:hypothetical protein
VRREANAAEAAERGRAMRFNALDTAILHKTREVDSLKSTIDHVERTGEARWNGMGQPPPPPTPREVEALRDKWFASATELLDLRRQRDELK